MNQQEAVNVCMNNCARSFGNLRNELQQTRDQNVELQNRV